MTKEEIKAGGRWRRKRDGKVVTVVMSGREYNYVTLQWPPRSPHLKNERILWL